MSRRVFMGCVVPVLAVLVAAAPLHAPAAVAADASSIVGEKPAPLEGSSGIPAGDAAAEEDAACEALKASPPWDEQEFARLLQCAFGLTDVKPGPAPLPAGPSGAAAASSACGEIDVEYAAQGHFSPFYRVPYYQVVYLMYFRCENGSPAVGYSTASQVVRGPNAPQQSIYCWKKGHRGIEWTRSSKGGCQTFVSVGKAIQVHVHQITNENDRRLRQEVMWVDSNHNWIHDIGEPYDLAFSPEEDDSDEFRAQYVYSENYTVLGVRLDPLPGQPLIVRANSAANLAFVLRDKLGLLKDSSIGAYIAMGPSKGSRIWCNRKATRTTGTYCLTSSEGRIKFSYPVAGGAQNIPRQDSDILRIFLDEDRDGEHDATEQYVSIPIRIGKPIEYVALGDSYSAGENGDQYDVPFVGNYLIRNPADLPCRRWSESYPLAFSGSLLNGQINMDTFDTFACTGATTYEVFGGESLPSANRPAPSLTSDPSAPEWEPTQGESLRNRRWGPEHVDMVTITIGGNDAGFGHIIETCIKSGDEDCHQVVQFGNLSLIQSKIRGVLAELKASAPNAAIFLLGYPSLFPAFLPDQEVCQSLQVANSLKNLNPGLDLLNGVVSPTIGKLVKKTREHLGMETDGVLQISLAEAEYLRESAEQLEFTLKRAALRAGVHYVDVSSGYDSFLGHQICTPDPWINGIEGVHGVGLDVLIWDILNDDFSKNVSGRSFHPNREGHMAYARILSRYINDMVRSGAELNDAGLPRNPEPSDGGPYVYISPPIQNAVPDGGSAAGSSGAVGGLAQQLDRGITYLVQERVVAAGSECGKQFAVPGEEIRLSAYGFAPFSQVTFIGAGLSATGAAVEAVAPGLSIADEDGRIVADWVVPESASGGDMSVPKIYAFQGVGYDDQGQVLFANMLVPLVSYPGTVPCALPDEATIITSVRQSVHLPLMMNDVVPSLGSPDPASVVVDDVSSGRFDVDAGTGSVTFTPNPGFHGVVRTRYWVYDNWGFAVPGEITVRVLRGCTVTGAPGQVEIVGTDSDDVICVADEMDTTAFRMIYGRGGDDIIYAGDGTDMIDGGAGSDTVYARGGDDTVYATAGDRIHAGFGFDTIYTQSRSITTVDEVGDYEVILTTPGEAVPSVPPSPGVDDFVVEPGSVSLLYVLDNDHDINDDIDPATLSISSAPSHGSARAVVLSDGQATIEYTAPEVSGADSFTYEICDLRLLCAQGQVTVASGNESCTIVGTDGPDILFGTPGNDVICGGPGNDIIVGSTGDDIIVGGPGDDLLLGGAGDDTLVGGAGADVLDGGSGSDLLYGGVGDDRLIGAQHSDTLHGGAGDDSLHGGSDSDVLYGGAGRDTLKGGSAADVLYGGADDDDIHGQEGDDSAWGNSGADVLAGGDGDDRLDGGSGDDRLEGGSGADALWGRAGNDTLAGGDGDDMARAGDGQDLLQGGDGDDVLYGEDGDDTAYGGDGDDALYGQLGRDRLSGDAGSDYLLGGSGFDACSNGEVTARCELDSNQK